MSGSASQGLEQQLLQHTLGIAAMAAPARVWVALCVSSPSEDAGGTEVSGGGYARVAAMFSMLSANAATNAATIEFPAATTVWGAVGYFEIWSDQTGAERLYWGPLVDPADGVTPLLLNIAAGDVVRFSPGTLSVLVAEQPVLTAGGPYLPLTGGTVTGTTTFSGAGNALNVTNTVTAATHRVFRNSTITTAPDRGVSSFISYSGTYTGAAQVLSSNSLVVSGDNVDGGAAGGLYSTYIGHQFGGSNTKGHRTGAFVSLQQTAKSGNLDKNKYFTAIGADASSNVNDNGTAGSFVGNLFGFNFLSRLTSGATFWNSVVGGEIDIVATAGVSVGYKEGFKVVLWQNDAVQGSVADYGIGLAASSAATLGFRIGLNFCSQDGYWPIDIANGTLIGAGTPFSAAIPKTAKLGVDFSSIAFLEAAYKSTGFQVDGAGIVTASTVQTGTTSGPTWTTGTAAPTATAPIGSLYSRVGGAVGATLYVSRGAGTWAAVAGV